MGSRRILPLFVWSSKSSTQERVGDPLGVLPGIDLSRIDVHHLFSRRLVERMDAVVLACVCVIVPEHVGEDVAVQLRCEVFNSPENRLTDR